MNNFSERLNEALDVYGIKDDIHRAAATASLLDVSPRTAKRWLDGECLPKAGKVNEIARTLGVDIDWLLTGEEGGRVEEDWPRIEKTASVAERVIEVAVVITAGIVLGAGMMAILDIRFY